ncbi:LOW QUALITY PROTEIN: complement component C7 [Boleophthalmus pectinirostris]|uniref:LOW QUALITY PROTEIN: complement component C7 n=1 Tax=Boleophthalmus pectinirostris TaxID=150288 RepID=UPI00242BC03D|nr:LOW QUALITY PROTEIN: complement component C7 [Boleophthalmus pectinirostris]
MFFTWKCPDPRVHCRWGPFGDWSECDGCTRTQTRYRTIAVYAQFGGNRCGGDRSETRSCEPTKSCPLEQGCGDRFRCRSGMCIPQTLMCNGDQDCEEDNEDESTCERKQHFVCDKQRPPPNIELLGTGVDLATGKNRGLVINTKSFGGQCRKMHHNAYRLPQSLLKYNFVVKVQNNLNDQMFQSEWHYRKDIVKRETVTGTTKGYRNYDYHETDDRKRNFHLLILKNNIELASFQATSPQYIPIAEEFWKALSKLPTVYNYAAYRALISRFGTHYLSEGTLGGSLSVIVRLDSDVQIHKITEIAEHNECERTKHYFLFFPIYRESCDRDYKDLSRKPNIFNKTGFVGKVTPEGGSDALIAQLQNMEISTPEANWRAYTDWADSVRSFPKVINSKLRPLWELVKEVRCAGVKKLYLKNAIEQYLSESHPCHCLPCEKNGIAVMDHDVCKCVPKPGSEAQDSERVEVDGCWSCWSAWSSCSGSSCSGGRKTRSRSCTNPEPRNGGQSCIGKATETGDCDDEELDYLRNFEPECFDFSLSPKLKCEPPPTLINGYILDPKDTYLVGHRVEYRCIAGFHLSGPSIFECTAAQTWSGTPDVCQISNCMMPTLAADVLVSPDKSSYDIGDSVTLSCPEGKYLEGDNTAICDPSLNFSPDPTEVTCKQVISKKSREPVNPSGQCKVWEKDVRGKCVCKLPNECGPSLELCASNPVIGPMVLTVCKLHALKCMKKAHAVAENSLCTWPVRSADSGCSNCHPWETCDEQTSTCSCRASADCSSPGLSVCVRVGSDSDPLTLSECEAGLRRCRGEMVTVVDIDPCPQN